VAVSRDVARARFAQVVKRALRDARERGMNDAAIAKATGVQPSTFHRWQRGEGTKLPQLEKVRAFCAGLDVPLRPALIALGIDETREPTPEIVDADLRDIARTLADPSVSEATKQAIRHTIRALNRSARAERSAREPADD
jgi:transcriptional regulator with XRE-family HTH domain